MKTQKVKKHSERGQSLMEFAFMLVLLLILVAGVVDGGRALYTFLAIRDAAQEGALYASIKPTDTAGIRARVCESSNLLFSLCGDDNVVDGDESIQINITYTNPSKKCMGVSGGKANGVKVEIVYPSFPLTMPFIGTFVGGQTVPISANAVDTILTPKC